MYDDFDDIDDLIDFAMPKEEFQLLKNKIKECIDGGWDVKDVLAEIYRIFQRYLLSEEQEEELYNIADPEELFNSPGEYYRSGAECLPLWNFVKKIMNLE